MHWRKALILDQLGMSNRAKEHGIAENHHFEGPTPSNLKRTFLLAMAAWHSGTDSSHHSQPLCRPRLPALKLRRQSGYRDCYCFFWGDSAY